MYAKYSTYAGYSQNGKEHSKLHDIGWCDILFNDFWTLECFDHSAANFYVLDFSISIEQYNFQAGISTQNDYCSISNQILNIGL